MPNPCYFLKLTQEGERPYLLAVKTIREVYPISQDKIDNGSAIYWEDTCKNRMERTCVLETIDDIAMAISKQFLLCDATDNRKFRLMYAQQYSTGENNESITE
jgi:hypothetical protein